MADRGHDPIWNLLYDTHDGAYDTNGNVAGHVECRRCGYDLFQLPARARCPECGAPVAASALGDWIQNSRPEWVEHIARWTQRCAWCNFALMCTALLLFFRETRLAGTVAMLFAGIAWAVSAWQSVEPEGSQTKIARAQLVARVASAVAGVLVGLMSAFAAGRLGNVELFTTMIFLAWIAYVVGSAAQMRVLSAIMYRGPSAGLGWRMGTRSYYLSFWHVSAGLAIAAEMNGSATCCFGLIACIGAFWVTLGTGLLQSRAAELLRIEARLARENLQYHEQVTARPKCR